MIAGFQLTAVSVWTQQPTPTGFWLAGIALLWLSARIVAFSSLAVSSVLDLLFAIALAIGIGIPIVGSRNRN